MKKILLLSLALLTVSCVNDGPKVFEAKTGLALYRTSKVKTLLPELEKRKSIVYPSYTWMPLLQFNIGKNHSAQYCLNYKTPKKGQEKEKTGTLRLNRVSVGSNCLDSYDQKTEATLKGIESFSLDVKESSVKFFIKILDKSHDFEIELLNVIQEKNFAIFSSSFTNFRAAGLYFLSFADQKTSQRERVEKLVTCKEVSPKCELKIEDRCSACPYGWFEVVGNSCEVGRTKLCAPVRCGERGEPACPRGTVYSGLHLNSWCYDGSPAGLCKKGLKVYCNSDGILVCR